MPDDQQPNVVQLQAPAAAAGQERQREADRAKLLKDTRHIVRAALLSSIEYERHRLKIAKELGLRVVFLDRKVDDIRVAISGFRARLIDGSFCTDNAGRVVDFHTGDLIEPTINIASGRRAGNQKYNPQTMKYEDGDGEPASLLLSCDGNLTVRHGVPMV